MIFRSKALAIIMLLGFLPIYANAETRNIVFPIDGEATFRNDFLEPRDGGARQHLGIDIIADKHTPVVAAVDGVISYIPSSEPSYGYMITIQDKDGYQYRYLHLNNDNPGTDDGNGGSSLAYAPGLRRGSEVRAGQLLGWVGDSGNAEWTVSHLHFEIRRPDRTAINPYDSLFAAPRASSVLVDNSVDSPQVDVGEAGVFEGAQLIFTIEIREGNQGEAIKELQTRLKNAGFFDHNTTTYFGPLTEVALKNYQSANGIAPTGVLGFETRELLNGNPITATGKILLKEELFEGMEGDAILQLQLKLEALGFYKGKTNGEYDSVTRESVRSYQKSVGVDTTGYVNYATWNKLNDSYKAIPTSTYSLPATVETVNEFIFTKPMSLGSQNGEVVELQKLLQTLGFFSKNVSTTGYFGPVTYEAVVSFQKAKGVDPIGAVGPLTQAALNNSSNATEEATPPKEVVPQMTSSTIDSYVFTEDLGVGSRGGEVVELQCLLRSLGYFDQNTLCTGYYGPITAKAVSDFQVAKGIGTVGIVDPATREALNTI